MPLPPLPGSPRGGDHEPDSIVAAVTSSHQSQSHSQSGKLHLICVNVCYYVITPQIRTAPDVMT